MHKGDYHTDYSKYYDKEYKKKDLAFEHVKKLKQEARQDHELNEHERKNSGIHEEIGPAEEGYVTIKRKKRIRKK